MALRDFFTSHRSRVAICELSLGREPADVTVLAIRTAATELRAAVEQAQLAIAVPEDGPARVGTLVDRDLAAYVDVIAAPTEEIVNAALAAVERTAPSVQGAVTGLVLPAGGDAAAAAFARAIVESYGTRTALVAARPPDAAALDGVTRALRWLQPLLAGSIEVLDAASSGLSLRTRDGAAPELRVPPRLFFDNDSLSTLLFYDASTSHRPRRRRSSASAARRARRSARTWSTSSDRAS